MGFCFVYDVTNPQSFDNINDIWIKEIEKHHTNFNDVPIILMGNKSDLVDQRKVSNETAKVLVQLFLTYKEFATNLGIPFIETSAKDKNNVKDAFLILATNILKRIVRLVDCQQTETTF